MTTSSILDDPLVSVGPEVTGDLDAAIRREWLVTNGLGGYASGTLAGIPTRRYHGLLVAATEPPGGRRVLVGGLVEWATAGDQRVALHAFEYADGTIDQHGYRRLVEFELQGALPVWRYEVAGRVIERRLWMAHGANTTFVRYAVVRGDAVDIEITPLLTDREFHSLLFSGSFDPLVKAEGTSASVRMRPHGSPLLMHATSGAFQPGGAWYLGVRHREETARGLDSLADLWAPGTFRARIAPGQPWTLVLAAEDGLGAGGAAGESGAAAADPEVALGAALARQRQLLDTADATSLPRPVQQLVAAADQFIVSRQAGGRTVIAGYHWFADWGRDTMIALPGLTLATGRHDDGADILRTFAGLVREGLLPNNLPESGGAAAGYNTVDAGLWFVEAVRAHVHATSDTTLLARLLPTVLEIVGAYAAGTRYGIGLDPTDGLLRAGERGQQLTWMDARVGDREITPRIGKPVEINALWLNALDAVIGWLPPGDPRRARWKAALDLGRRSFVARFWMADRGYLADVVDGPEGDDRALRPNQVIALALPIRLLDDDQGRSMLNALEARLLTPYGLRTLDPRAPEYRGAYAGDAAQRDGSYHQGPAWTWLMGAYVDAVARLRSRGEALVLVEGFGHHLLDAGVGSVSELLDGDPPHHPRGAIAQAWGVAEVLRSWRALLEEPGG